MVRVEGQSNLLILWLPTATFMIVEIQAAAAAAGVSPVQGRGGVCTYLRTSIVLP